MQPTALFRTLCDIWQLEQGDRLALLQALGRCTGAEPHAWAAAVMAFDLAPVSRETLAVAVLDWLDDISPPARVVEAVLESLATEHVLTRRQVTRMEEHVLACVNAQGRWHWAPHHEGALHG